MIANCTKCHKPNATLLECSEGLMCWSCAPRKEREIVNAVSTGYVARPLPMLLPFENREAVDRIMNLPEYETSEAMQAHVKLRLEMSPHIDMNSAPPEQDPAPLIDPEDGAEATDV